MNATITIDGVSVQGSINLHVESESGTCIGCVFEHLDSVQCPKDQHGKLLCSSNTPRPIGIYKFEEA